MYITINNEKYELTMENIFEIQRQEAIETAKNAIDYLYDCYNLDAEAVENLTERELVEIGEKIENRIYSNISIIEYDVIEWYGLIKED